MYCKLFLFMYCILLTTFLLRSVYKHYPVQSIGHSLRVTKAGQSVRCFSHTRLKHSPCIASLCNPHIYYKAHLDMSHLVLAYWWFLSQKKKSVTVNFHQKFCLFCICEVFTSTCSNQSTNQLINWSQKVFHVCIECMLDNLQENLWNNLWTFEVYQMAYIYCYI